jgi:hypothetical protein
MPEDRIGLALVQADDRESGQQFVFENIVTGQR